MNDINIDMVFNFAKAVVNHAKDNFRHADEETLNKRLDICNACDKNSDGRCTHCGCFIKIKASWCSEKCPLDKW